MALPLFYHINSLSLDKAGNNDMMIVLRPWIEIALKKERETFALEKSVKMLQL